jgi:hypothetical protein
MGGDLQILGLLMLMAIPALGFLLLVVLLERWGRAHDPMKPSHLDHLAPRRGQYDSDDNE